MPVLSLRQRPVRGAGESLGLGGGGRQTLQGLPCPLGCRGLVSSGSLPRFEDFPGSVLSRVFLLHTLLTAMDGSCEPSFLPSSVFILIKEILNATFRLPISLPPSLPSSYFLFIFRMCIFFLPLLSWLVVLKPGCINSPGSWPSFVDLAGTFKLKSKAAGLADACLSTLKASPFLRWNPCTFLSVSVFFLLWSDGHSIQKFYLFWQNKLLPTFS